MCLAITLNNCVYELRGPVSVPMALRPLLSLGKEPRRNVTITLHYESID